MTAWIYKPLSGDRVFAERATPSILALLHRNGCRSVAGGVTLSIRAEGAPRVATKAVATAIVQAVGGLAWDAQGEISIIVPREHAWRTWTLLRRTVEDHAAPPARARRHHDWRAVSQEDILRAEAALLAAGCARLDERLRVEGRAYLPVSELLVTGAEDAFPVTTCAKCPRTSRDDRDEVAPPTDVRWQSHIHDAATSHTSFERVEVQTSAGCVLVWSETQIPLSHLAPDLRVALDTENKTMGFTSLDVHGADTVEAGRITSRMRAALALPKVLT